MQIARTTSPATELGYAIASVLFTLLSIALLSSGDGSPLAGNVHGLVWLLVGYQLTREGARDTARSRAFVLAGLSALFSVVMFVVAVISEWPDMAMVLLAISTIWSGLGTWMFAPQPRRRLRSPA